MPPTPQRRSGLLLEFHSKTLLFSSIFFFKKSYFFDIILDHSWTPKSASKHNIYNTKRDFALCLKVMILTSFLGSKSRPQTSNLITFRPHVFIKISLQENWKHQIRVVYTALRAGQRLTTFLFFFNLSLRFLSQLFNPLRDPFWPILAVPETLQIASRLSKVMLSLR